MEILGSNFLCWRFHNEPARMPKIDLSIAQRVDGSRYPSPYQEPCRLRQAWRLGEAVGLTHIGVNLVLLPPGAWSSQRHWHTHEDEFVYLIEGELILKTDAGETLLRAGECAGFKAGDRDGHCLINRSETTAKFLVMSNRSDLDHGAYSDIDMQFLPGRYSGGGGYARKDGSKIE
jgi:uncharacterized cupin superfamily protein